MSTEIQMPRYQAHKKVWALEIKNVNRVTCTISFADDGYADLKLFPEIFNRYIPVEGDFYVVYEDGYKSFSPRKAFIDGYTKI